MKDGIEILSKSLEKLVNVRKLFLQIGDFNNLGEEDSIAIGNGISKMIKLEELSLLIDGENKIKSQGAQGICKGI